VTLASENLEKAALEDLHAAATPELVSSLGLCAIRFDSAFVSVAAALPPTAIVVNRALGIGLGRPADTAGIERITEAYRSAGVSRYFVQVHPDARPDNLQGLLESSGLAKARGWQKFSRDTDAPTGTGRTELEVREAGPADAEDFGRIVCSAFDLGDVAAPWLGRLPGRAGWHIFMSFDSGEAAGTGALFIHGDQGWLDFAATAPRYRRRGSQGAIQAARIRRAIKLGCRKIYTCTGVANPGDPQHSYRNILKAGFRKEYIRENFAPKH
jgi:GNAT superfamily N-acetyltransferase